jgi:rare lipoprotein A
VILAVALSACSSSRKGGYYKDDGPPKRSVDVASIKDPVPRSEPPSKTGNNPYKVFGKSYTPLKSSRGYRQQGRASWYGKKFHGKRTSSGEIYDMYEMTAAHKILPIPSYVRVTNLDNGRSAIVRVNDRGPFKSDRIIDLSYAAALKLDIVRTGTARVEVAAIDEGSGSESRSNAVQLPANVRLYIQLGAFSNQQSAYQMQRRLGSSGFSDVTVTSALVGNLKLYRVRIGPIVRSDSADMLLADLRNAGYSEARYVVE